MGIRALEIRAILGLARLWEAAGRKPHSMRLLRESLDRVTDGVDTFELLEVRRYAAATA